MQFFDSHNLGTKIPLRKSISLRLFFEVNKLNRSEVLGFFKMEESFFQNSFKGGIDRNQIANVQRGLIQLNQKETTSEWDVRLIPPTFLATSFSFPNLR
jgi:hypothetical protein